VYHAYHEENKSIKAELAVQNLTSLLSWIRMCGVLRNLMEHFHMNV